MRVIGIDPGIATTGYGVVERSANRLAAIDLGVIHTPADLPGAARLARLRSSMDEVIARSGADVAVVERLFFNANAKTAMAVGQAAGVVLACAAERGLEVRDYTPLEVKQSVVGFGGASKKQVQAMVAALLSLDGPPRSPDAADACALAICHLNRSGLESAVARARRSEAG